MQNILRSNMFDIGTRLTARWSDVGGIFSLDLARRGLSGMSYDSFETVVACPKKSWVTGAIRTVPL